ncbi:MAG TPA: M1 family aminopeptidase [Thermoanaerobaculia bacterium]|nr:M1 family aminopeptidase [Thermoanaerobaculia bacterium]
MRRLSLLFSAIGLFAAITTFAASDPTYTAIRASRPDGRTIALQNFTFDRDVFHFTLNGTLHLLAPVDGKEVGAVFIGAGSYELKPASVGELRQLTVLTSDEKFTSLVDQFDSAVFLGTAIVDIASKAAAPVKATADANAVQRYERYLERQRKDLTTNVHLRVLQEQLDGGEPFFYAFVDGKKYPPAALIVDPRSADAMRLVPLDFGGEQTAMIVFDSQKGGVWYASRYRSELQKGSGTVVPPLADAQRYVIDATINDAQMNATTTLTLAATNNFRVLPVDLASRMRISAASFGTDGTQWTPVPCIQEDAKGDADVAIVFPRQIQRGETIQLKLTYGGDDVLASAGDGNFTVGARTSWYPNVGIGNDVADYELHFTTPQKFSVVSVGEEVENKVSGEQRVAVWKSTHPLRVAGFNYGKFKKLSQSDKDSGMTFDVYTNPGEPDIIRDINRALDSAGAAMGELGDPQMEDIYVGPRHIKIDTGSLAKAALADGINTARTANAYYGTLPSNRVAITQQSQWFFGQSWPGLIYLPYVAFVNGTVRNTLGLNDVKDFVDNVGAHELAHQWWGHQVGPRTYHDTWLSEGFAEFTAALVAQQTGGWPRYDAFWEKARRNIMERPRGAAIDNLQAGPISQGPRLRSWLNPAAYDVIVYSKGAYVLHMLRMAMYDRQKGDEAFMAMMKDFASTYAGKSATTGDFQAIVEKHATPNLRLTQDGKLNWFFEQWVYGTAVPKITSNLTFTPGSDGKYKVTGTIAQSEVPAGFASIVPIYVHFDKNSSAKIGGAVLIGSTSKQIDFEIALPKKPQRFAVNSMHDVLSR